MKIYLTLLVFVLMVLSFGAGITAARASDHWICKEESSYRDGGGIHACGIGQGTTETDARISAFKAAKAEFEMICGASADCKSNHAILSPGRQTCDLTPKGYTCHRELTFNFLLGADPQEVAVQAIRGDGLECHDSCNSKNRQCDGQGDMWVWNKGCHDAYQRAEPI